MDGSVYVDGCPNYIAPPPPIVHLPLGIRDNIRTEAVRAFSVFWSDYAACLNRIRNTLELMLDDLNVPRSARSNNGSLNRISLHQRIERLKKMKPKLLHVCNRMIAVKHLGNAGSHGGSDISISDVFDAFDILEQVLHDVYSTDASELERKVKEINKRKGPRK